MPRIAASHHEYLNGSGYPNRLPGKDIPVESRIMTIADIFDALTASDRPYKKAVPIDRALSIIESEVKAGKCDAELFRCSSGRGLQAGHLRRRSRGGDACSCEGGRRECSMPTRAGGWRRACARRCGRSGARGRRRAWC